MKNLLECYGPLTNEQGVQSGVVLRTKGLWSSPFGLLTNDDLRFLIDQELGLEHTIPVALDRLADNPLNSGDSYVGDLLVAIINVPHSFWLAHPELNDRVADFSPRLESVLRRLQDEIVPILERWEYSKRVPRGIE